MLKPLNEHPEKKQGKDRTGYGNIIYIWPEVELV